MRLPRSQALSLDLAMAPRLRSLSSANSTREGWKSAGPRRNKRPSLPERDGRASLRYLNTPMAVYAGGKAALNGFTQNITLQCAGKRVRANCVLPGYIETPFIY